MPSAKAWFDDPAEWPLPWEPVDTFWAKQALQLGNPRILARYLREAEEVEPAVLQAIAAMLGQHPRRGWILKSKWTDATAVGQLSPAHVADLFDPPRGRPRMIFARPGRGNPGDPDQHWRDRSIGAAIWFQLRQEGGKLYLAIEAIQKRLRISRATAYRAWKAFKGPTKA